MESSGRVETMRRKRQRVNKREGTMIERTVGTLARVAKIETVGTGDGHYVAVGPSERQWRSTARWTGIGRLHSVLFRAESKEGLEYGYLTEIRRLLYCDQVPSKTWGPMMDPHLFVRGCLNHGESDFSKQTRTP